MSIRTDRTDIDTEIPVFVDYVIEANSVGIVKAFFRGIDITAGFTKVELAALEASLTENQLSHLCDGPGEYEQFRYDDRMAA